MSKAGKSLEIRKQKVLETWVNNPTLSYEQVAETAGVSISTFYRYRHDPEFMEQYHELCKRRFNSLEAKAIEALETQLDIGTWQAVKYVLDGLGYKPADKVEADLTTDVVVNIGK